MKTMKHILHADEIITAFKQLMDELVDSSTGAGVMQLLLSVVVERLSLQENQSVFISHISHAAL